MGSGQAIGHKRLEATCSQRAVGLEGVRQEPNEIGLRTQARNVSPARRASVWRADGQRQHQILVVTNFAVENNGLLRLYNLERTCNEVLRGAMSSYTT